MTSLITKWHLSLEQHPGSLKQIRIVVLYHFTAKIPGTEGGILIFTAGPLEDLPAPALTGGSSAILQYEQTFAPL